MDDAHLLHHVVPVNDLREHVTDGTECWCHPEYDDIDCLVIHNSMDDRESYEEGRKPQ